MSIFSGVENADYNGGGRYVRPGCYLVTLQLTTMKESQQGKGSFTIVEMIVDEVLTSFEREMEPDGKVLRFEASNSAGESMSWINMQRFPSFLGNIKGFISGLCDIEIDKVTEADCVRVFPGAADRGAANADGKLFSGMQLIVDGIKTAKRNGGPFTKVIFRPVVE